ncbi:hypothetical protein BDV29DRAFT_197996 [Aspergillus leporis]|uniref:C2H2-type domain-containing protein n=1 Tax=Aspergillus leporis TaxID=41062 RepID=A0A5N5WRV6_9EURO|nr:hypothetical protein BDV29DRAFT_197996 [Aspergillus leporis]
MTGKDSTLGFTQLIDLEEHDNSEMKQAILNRTKAKYDRTLGIFDKYLVLHPKASWPLDIRSYKGFLEFVARNTKGRLEERPTVGTIEGFRRDFEAGLVLRRGYETPENVSTTLREWVKKDLKEKVSLCTDEMDGDGLSPNDLAILMTQLWCRDYKEYRGKYPDRTRVQLSAAMLLYCFTSARTGEVLESTARRERARKQKGAEGAEDIAARVLAACYKHFVLTVELVDGVKMIVLTYSREYVKGYWKKKKYQLPIHGFYEIYKEELPLMFNLLVFFLPMAVADGAFCEYKSVDEILDAAEFAEGEPEEKIVAKLIFKPEILDTPVFRPYNEQSIGDSTGRSRGADSFGKEFAELGHRAGYKRNVTVRACRRWALMETDKRHSATARMKFAGHVDQRTFGKSYAHPLSDVDGPATFLGIASRHEHIQNRRSMGMHRHPHLWQSLPAKAEFEFQERDDVQAIDDEMQQLGARLDGLTDDSEKHEIRVQQHRLYNKKQKLYMEELKRLRQTQPRNCTSQPSSVYEQTFFHYTRRVMPERDLLAQVLPKIGNLRSPTGRAALKALEAICSGNGLTPYRSGIRPLHGKCLCGEVVETYQPHRRWSHLYRCYGERLRQVGGIDFVEYCFECDCWFQGLTEWDAHCQGHLDRPGDLLRCDLIVFRNVPAKAAYCPFCLGDKTRSPRRRMWQYLDRGEWFDHVQSHLNHRELAGRYNCRHPACSQDFDNRGDLEYHLRDVHCYLPPRGKKREFNQIT